MVEILNVRPNSEEEQSLIREALIVTSVQLFPPLTSNEEEPAILLALQADLQTLLNQGKRQVAGGSFVGFFSQHDLVKIAKHILQVLDPSPEQQILETLKKIEDHLDPDS